MQFENILLLFLISHLLSGLLTMGSNVQSLRRREQIVFRTIFYKTTKNWFSIGFSDLGPGKTRSNILYISLEI